MDVPPKKTPKFSWNHGISHGTFSKSSYLPKHFPFFVVVWELINGFSKVHFGLPDSCYIEVDLEGPSCCKKTRGWNDNRDRMNYFLDITQGEAQEKQPGCANYFAHFSGVHMGNIVSSSMFHVFFCLKR